MTERRPGDPAGLPGGSAPGTLETLLDLAPVGLGVLDRELRYVAVNRTLAEMNGLPPEAHLGRTLAEVLPDLGAEVARAIRSVLDGAGPIHGFEATGRVPGHAGELREWVASYLPVREGELITGVHLVVEDVTERRRAERASRSLAEAAARLSGALTPDEVAAAAVDEILPGLGASMGAVTVRGDQDLPRILALVGTRLPASRLDLPAEGRTAWREVIGRNEPLFFGSAAERDRAFPYLAGLAIPELDGATAFFPLHDAEGEPAGLLTIGFPGPRIFSPDERRVLGAIADLVSEALDRGRLYEVEREARRASERLAAIVRSTSDAVVSTDLEGRVTAWNEGAHRLFGWTEEEMLGRPMHTLAPPERRPEVDELVARARAGEEIRRVVTQRLTKAGTRVDVAVTISPIRDASGRILGDARIFRDLAAERRGEVEARRAEDRFRGLLESNPSAILLVNTAGTITFANPRAAQIFRYRQDDLVGRSVEDLVPEAFRTAHPGLRERYHADPTTRAMGHGRDLWARARDGTLVPVEIGLSSFVSGGERFVTATIIDITGRRQAEEQLRSTTAQLQAIVENSPLGVLVLDAEGRITFANPAVEGLLGWTPAELVGGTRPWRAAGLEEGHPDPLATMLAGQPVLGADLRITRRDGTVLQLEAHGGPIRDGGGRVVGAVELIADVSARRAAETARQEAVETLDAVLASTPVATILVDLEGRIRFWNDAAERLFGMGADEAVGHRMPFASGDEGAAALEALLERGRRGETVSGGEARVVGPGGRDLLLDVFAGPARDASGTVTGVVAALVDVSTQRALEEQLIQAQKMESVGRLAGGVAHDFNNILTAITGFAELLLYDLPEEGPSGAPSRERANAEGIKAAADRAAGLTRQLLAFSRRQVLSPEVLDINEIVSGMTPMLRRLISEDIDLSIRLGEGLGPIRADPSQLEQVILNLVVNARDAMPGGGKLAIETEARTFDEPYSSEHFEVRPGPYVVISVSDTGQGMDRETRLHIFEPFFTTKRQGEGTGLGLSTTYGIVRQSGGHIWLYSEPGQGTTFKVYFPEIGDAERRTRPEAGGVPSRGQVGRILVVEDADVVREIARVILERQGYEVITAADPEEALQRLDDLPALDLVISDVVMPGRSGPDMVREVRRRRPGLAALFLSGYTEEMIGAHGQVEGGDGFLGKPFTPDALARKVAEVLASAREEADAAGR